MKIFWKHTRYKNEEIKYPEVGLLDRMVVLFWILWEPYTVPGAAFFFLFLFTLADCVLVAACVESF